MLVLTRKENEQIQIGDQVVITVLQVKGQSVRIGIEAPREVLVLRAELPRHEHAPNANRVARPESAKGVVAAEHSQHPTTNHRAGLSSGRRTTTRHATTTKPRRTRTNSDPRRHPDRTQSFAARPAFLNQL